MVSKSSFSKWSKNKLNKKSIDGGRTLLICKNLSAYNVFCNFVNLTEPRNIVISTEDIDVQATAIKKGLTIAMLDDSGTIYDMAPEVLDMLATINNWLLKLGTTRKEKDMLYWCQHVEGGGTTQRILDSMVVLRGYTLLFSQIVPDEVIFIEGNGYNWEDEIALACAKGFGIPVTIIRTSVISKIAYLVKLALRPWVLQIYNTIVILYLKFKYVLFPPSAIKAVRPYIALQLCGDNLNHYLYTTSLVDAFAKEELHCIFLTNRAKYIPKLIRNKGYDVVEFETMVSIAEIAYSWVLSLKCLFSAYANKHEFLSSNKLDITRQAIRKVLWWSVVSFIVVEFPYRVRIDYAARRFFLKHPPLAARLYTDILPEGVIVDRVLKSLDIFCPVFRHIGLDHLPNPYAKHDAPADIYFCSSEVGRRTLINEGLGKKRIINIGASQFERIKVFRSAVSVASSRQKLGIPIDASLVVFCDTQVVLRGYFTRSEQVQLVNTVLEFSVMYDDVYIIFKPHPTALDSELAMMMPEKISNRIILLKANDVASDGINAAHVVLTKVSTLVAEAMVIGIPSICVLFDKKKNWQVYGDAVDYAFDNSELLDKLSKLRDVNYYEKWKQAMCEPQQLYMTNNFSPPVQDTLGVIVSVMKAEIKKYKLGF